MKKIVTLLVACALTTQSIGGVIAGAEGENEQTMSIGEIMPKNESAGESENEEIKNEENEKITELNETEDSDNNKEKAVDENDAAQEKNEENSSEDEETKLEEADKNDEKAETEVESEKENEDRPVLMSTPIESSFVKGAGSYTFDNEPEFDDWKCPDGKISFAPAVDATGNGGGSIKFEYITKTHPSQNQIKASIPLSTLYSDIAYGECYTVSCKVKGERVKNGAKAYINISSQLNTDQFYPIGLPKSGGTAIGSEWETISLDFIYSSVLGNLEIMFPDGLSKQNDAANYDIYYIDDIKLEKHDTIDPYAEAKGWLKRYSGENVLKVSEKSIDLSETNSLMQTGDKQQIIAYTVSGSEVGEPAGNTKREKTALDGFSFKSSEESVATVDDNGIITAVSDGYTFITASKGTDSAKFLLTVVDNISAEENYVLSETSNYFGKIKDFTGMRDYIYMSFLGSNNYSYAKNATAMNVKTPHVASFKVYDPGTSAFDMNVYYGNYDKNVLWGGTSNQWYDTSYRWSKPDNGFEGTARHAGWHQVALVVDYPTEHSAADGYMACAVYVDGTKVVYKTGGTKDGNYEFETSPWKNELEFYLRDKGLIKEAYVVKCGNDFTLESVTPQSRTDIDVNQSFVFEFSNPIDKTTVDENVVFTDGKQEIPATVTAEGKRLTVTPEYPLEREDTYTVTLKKDLAAEPKVSAVTGNMGADRNFIFTAEKYPLSCTVLQLFGKNMKVELKNNTNESKDAYCVISFYKDNACADVAVREVNFPKNSAELILKNLTTDKITDYKYEIAVYDKNSDGSIGKLLSKPEMKDGIRETLTTDISPKNETRITAGYNSDKGIVEITGYSKTKRSGLPVLVNIRKKGADNTIKNIIRTEAVKTGKNGEVNYNFKLKADDEKERYTVTVAMPFEDTVYEREFNYIDLTEARAYLKQIDNASTNAAVAATDIFNPEKDPFCILDSSFNDLKNKDLLYGAILENKPYADRASDVVSYFKSIYTNALDMNISIWGNEQDCIDDIRENHSNEYWNIKENEAYKTFFEKFGAVQQKNVVGKLKNAKKFADISEIFYLEVIREDITNQSSYSTVYSTLAKYNDIHKINYSVYNELSETKKISVAEKFQKAIGTITSVKELKSTFETYAENEKETKGGNSGESGNSGNSGGSGSKSSGGSYSGTPVGNPEISTKIPDWYEDAKNSASAKIFDDLDSAAWAEESINKLYKLGAISGKTEKLFDPNASIKREELCKIVAAAFKLEKNEEAGAMNFADVGRGQWYTEYVELCYQNGVINGIDDNTFGVGRTVTREEIATILVRAAEAVGKSLDYYFTIFPFADEDEISDWAKKNVHVLRECMIINGVGDGRFAPKDNVTRAQAAKMIAGILDFNY